MTMRERLEKIAVLAKREEAKLRELGEYEMESHYADMTWREAYDLAVEIRKAALGEQP